MRRVRALSLALVPTWIVAATVTAAVPARARGPRQEPPSVRPSARPAVDDNELSEADRARLRRLSRKSTELELEVGSAEGKVKIAYGFPATDSREYREMEALEPGRSVRFYEQAAIKLSTDLDLLFGETRIARENVAPDYPGVYSLWLERTKTGWDLVFNDKADVWGTRHDAGADVARVALEEGRGSAPTDALQVELAAWSDGTDTLELRWGEHLWRTTFRPAP